MIFVKFIVLIGCINRFCVCQTNYCKICLNHTLCKYNMPGPSLSCKSYDNTALLKNQDITELVNKINERRNFVALGYSKFLPQAANMKKIHWSSELAFIAQRWADQCVPSIHPEKEDLCRDLENTKVGQVISSVVDPSSKLNVKSFVEMWFIQILNYSGSVIYYNQSQDYRTSFFTQLIWANTEAVGCGKAKFYVDERKSMLERLVCNFAPKGNTHGKPIYSIGYAGTQCSNNMIPDNVYKGLCDYEDRHFLRILTTESRPVNSLLRILNLSNNSVKHEIDPIGNNLKQILVNSSSNDEHRNQKTRHIYVNNSYAPIRRIMPLQKPNTWKSVINMTRNDDDHHFQHQRGHSHLYHGHNTENPPQMYSYPITSEINYNNKQDFRRYDYTTPTINEVSNNDYRKFYQHGQCTRSWPQVENNNCCSNNQCTKSENCCQQTTCPLPCPEQFTNPVLDLCPLQTCSIQTCPTPSTCSCNCNMRCPYSSPTCPTTTNCYTTSCREMHCNDCRKSGSFQNYDMMPNVVVRSGNKRVQDSLSPKKETWLFDDLKINHSHQGIYERADLLHKDETEVSKYNLQDRDYLYRSFDTRLRKRRQLDDEITLVPFWKLEKTNYKKQLKSMRYTTLSNKNNRNTKRNTALAKWLSSTEPITLNIADYDDDSEQVTEKYLSFNELMHLRKINDGYAVYDFRRQDSKKTTKKKDSTTKKETTKKETTKKETTKKETTKKETTTKTTKAATNKTTTTKTATNKTTATTKKASETVAVDKNATTKSAATTAQKTVEVVTEETTITFTQNTPFERLRHCTRKLTCTWTAFTGNSPGEDGGNIFGPPEVGSRTPPGYVEGCTRTSTCTRINLERNKVFSLSTSSVTIPGNGDGGNSDDRNRGTDSSGRNTGNIAVEDDEDYCERRSLNVQRRNSDNKERLPTELENQDYTRLSIRSGKFGKELDITSETRGISTSVSGIHECFCIRNNARKKRQESAYSKKFILPGDMHCRDSKKSFSYGELYYMILNKIYGSKSERQLYHNECPCNGSSTSGTMIFLLIYFTSMFNVCINVENW